ncbi:MAG: DUF5678 domain-containing protein [Acidobacteriota bacterium]
MANAAYQQALEVVRALSPEEQRQLLQEIKAERLQQSQSVNGTAVVNHHRQREMRWFADKQNRAKYGGQWVALDGDQLLSYGDDLRQVFAEARAKGSELPFTGFVEPLDALPFGGW